MHDNLNLLSEICCGHFRRHVEIEINSMKLLLVKRVPYLEIFSEYRKINFYLKLLKNSKKFWA